mmetsp:Transcript_13413/g.25239  ORF Transcript_13413/g.25239 Transcript_13413/m.25239 type:complete len:220 (-) Transcript_13413:57-716(-)
MSSTAKYCSVCSMAFPSGDSLLTHFMQTHQKNPNPKESPKPPGKESAVTEWFLPPREIKPPRHSYSHDIETSFVMSLESSQSPESGGSKDSGDKARGSDSNVSEVLVIDTDPVKEVAQVVVPASSVLKQLKPMKLQKQKVYTKCPVKDCTSMYKHLNKLEEHFARVHTYTCSFESCKFTHFNLSDFCVHVKKDHKQFELPVKRQRTLDEEAAAACRGFK